MTRRPRLGLASLLAAPVWLAGVLHAQEPDSVPAREGIAPAVGECILRWRPLESDTRSVTNRDVVGEHVTYLSGRYLWTCGSATMQADSAIKRDGPHQVELFGRVVYEDTIRTLRSDRLLYFQLSDFVIAEENVALERLADGSTLTGPRVEFLRAVSGVDAFTTAPGRPTVLFYPEQGESREPFVVEADAVVFAGENEARFAGNAVITRSDLNARADTAYLTREDGVGLLWGEPWIEAEGIRLEGDTIRFRSEREELQAVHALGGGYASGENFDVRAEAIDIALDNREVEDVWAYGEGVGEATSGSHVLYGDSLHFAMYRSQIDTVYAVGEAVAIQRDTAFEALDVTGESGEEAGETDAEPGEEGESDEPGEGGEEGEAEEEADPEDDEGPELALDGSMNWARADTLVGVFERPEPVAADPAAVGATGAVDSVAAAEPAMSRLELLGGASALYRMVRDSIATSRPSRNYLVGTRIGVHFEDGQPVAVTGEHAIGVYLEPREVFGEEVGGEDPSDSTEVVDAAAADSTAGETPAGTADDSTGVRPDTLSAPPDTSSAPPDTLAALRDTLPRAGWGAVTPIAVLPVRRPPGREARRAPAVPAYRSRRIS